MVTAAGPQRGPQGRNAVRAGLVTSLVLLAIVGSATRAQQPSADGEALGQGRNYIATRSFTAASSSLAMILPVRLRAVASGLMMERVRSVGMENRLIVSRKNLGLCRSL